MTTDNRTNEPTEAQVEAAVHAAWAKSREFRGVGGQAEFAPPWEFQQVIRAALVAAAGVAQVQPSSTVDEGKIADALIEELMTDLAVEEWSAEKVENTGKRLARAVVEAIGGESRGEW